MNFWARNEMADRCIRAPLITSYFLFDRLLWEHKMILFNLLTIIDLLYLYVLIISRYLLYYIENIHQKYGLYTLPDGS